LHWESGRCKTGAFFYFLKRISTGNHFEEEDIVEPTYLSMPKFLADCHYNEEEISQHLKRIKTKIYIYIYIGYCPVQVNGNKFATGQILKKPVEVVKGWFLAG
jgi:hypothetical protein